MRLRVRAVPKASSEGVAGWIGDELRVRVTAAPEKRRANAAVERVVAGPATRRKILEIEGLEEAEVRRRLARSPITRGEAG